MLAGGGEFQDTQSGEGQREQHELRHRGMGRCMGLSGGREHTGEAGGGAVSEGSGG